jgi:hypothetical protein
MAWCSTQIVLNGMGGGEKHLKLTSIVFQTLFAPIDVAKVTALKPFPNGCPATLRLTRLRVNGSPYLI